LLTADFIFSVVSIYFQALIITQSSLVT